MLCSGEGCDGSFLAVCLCEACSPDKGCLLVQSQEVHHHVNRSASTIHSGGSRGGGGDGELGVTELPLNFTHIGLYYTQRVWCRLVIVIQ